MTSGELHDHQEAERSRVQAYRSTMTRTTKSKQYKTWDQHKRSEVSRQKKDYLKKADRTRKSSKSAKKLSPTTPGTSPNDASTNSPKPSSSRSSLYRNVQALRKLAASMTPKSRSCVLSKVYGNSSPCTKAALTEYSSVIDEKSCSMSRTTVWRKQNEVTALISSGSANDKKEMISNVFGSRTSVTQTANDTIVRNLQLTFDGLGRNDNYSRVIKSTVVHSAIGEGISGRGIARAFGAGRGLVAKLAKMKNDAASTWRLSFRQAPRSSKLTDVVRDCIIKFYYQHDVSRNQERRTL